MTSLWACNIFDPITILPKKARLRFIKNLSVAYALNHKDNI